MKSQKEGHMKSVNTEAGVNMVAGWPVVRLAS